MPPAQLPPCSSARSTDADAGARPAWKAEADLIARAALAGVRVIRSTADNGQPEWIASRWNLTRAFGSLEELERWLAVVVGAAR